MRGILAPADVMPPGHPLLAKLGDFTPVDPGNTKLPMRDLRGKWGLLSAVLPLRPLPGLAKHGNRAIHWLCACECGSWVTVRSDRLTIGQAVACTLPCFEKAVARHATAHGVTHRQARVALLAVTRSPLFSPAREAALVGRKGLWKMPPWSRTGDVAQGTITAGASTIAAIEAAWSITGVVGECTITVRGSPRPAHAREQTGYGFHVRWYWRASVTRTSDGRICEGGLRHSVRVALEALLATLQKDRETR